MKSKPLFQLITALSLLSAVLPMQAALAAAAEPAAPENLMQFSSGGHVLGFNNEGMYAATGTHALHVDFLDANRVRPQSGSPASGQGRAAALGRVAYAGLWDGIDLVYSAGSGGIYTTTYMLAPGADPGDIRLRYNAPLTFNEDGTLSIAFETGAMTESAPIAWQDIDNQRVPVDVSFRVSGHEVSFDLGTYNPRYALTIDPSLVWNTFLGGTANDGAYAIAVDGSGNTYVAAYSFDAWGTPVRAYTGGTDCLVAKLNASGGLVWHTFLGGSGNEHGYGISAAADGSNIYVVGDSSATWGTPVRAYTTSSRDAFAAKLNSAGGLVWNTFLGGSSLDDGNDIAVDGSGNVYVTGASYAAWESPVRAYTSGQDAFAAKLSSAGSLSWNTFLGGTGDDGGSGIDLDGSGNIYLAGYSENSWGTPVRAYTDDLDAFAAKLNASTGALTWNTFLGGSAYDGAMDITVSGISAYVSGISEAAWGSPVRAYTAGRDTFGAKLNSAGSLSWHTFLGGSGYDSGGDIAVDGNGDVLLAGTSDANWGTPLRAYSAGYDGFAARLNSSGTLISNLFLGSAGSESGTGIAAGTSDVYVAGIGGVTWGNPVRPVSGGTEVFVAKVNLLLPGSFNKTAPADGSFAAFSPTLSWGASIGAESYEYCYDTTNNNACDTSWVSTGTSTSIGLSGLANNDTYYWQVRATGIDGATAADSGTWWSFTTPTFADVPITYWAWSYIERLFNAGITGGCATSPLRYCPANTVSRAEMAIFLLRGIHGSAYTPPAAAGTVFADVPIGYWAAAWIEQLSDEGITGGCGGGNYCPGNPVSRAEMAIFLLRAEHGSAYTPPAATGTVFGDVPISYWAAAWIEQLNAEGITGGCGGGNYCPNQSVTRAEMAIFLVRTFSLP